MPDIKDFSEDVLQSVEKTACQIDRRFFLYGGGEIARELFLYLKKYHSMEPEGFIVSDGQEIFTKDIGGRPVLSYSEFKEMKGTDEIVIPALMPVYHKEIFHRMKKNHIDYMELGNPIEYLTLINRIRCRISVTSEKVRHENVKQ